MATESSKTRRYRNINRQMVHDDLLAAAKSKRMTVTRYSISIGTDSNFQTRIMGAGADQRAANPTEYTLKQLAHDMREAHVKRRWRDYILPEPEVEAEPEQMEMDPETIKPAPDKPDWDLENELLEGLRGVASAILRAHNAGYDFEISIKKKKVTDA